ncbi:hypothetical protein LI142_12370 [Eubacterium limosum]|uniref:Lipoprotein n=1 Tax=Eubacterium limosum TaxID=1736 RepID=A0ABT5UR70_EUBLI|nr:hypothetical protein [Eubacterium limosum]MCB6570288.1 hypothetical protein [Eubacterium limosum]MDE1471450.1 hypothetical protein [Eubacterium limosum]
MKYKAVVFLSVLVFAALLVTACSNTGQKKEEIPNPMVRYDTIDQIEKKVGYSPAILPAYSGFELKEMYIIGDEVVDLRYQKTGGAEATVRSQKNAEGDISGYQQLSYSPEIYNDLTYNIAENADDKAIIAYFTKGDMTYSMSAIGLDKDTFKSEFAAVIDAVNNQ